MLLKKAGLTLHRLLLQKCTWQQYRHLQSQSKDQQKISKVLNGWEETFSQHDVPEPLINAQYITAHVLGQKTLSDIDLNTPLTVEQLTQVNDLCSQRLTRMPLQYVLGEWDFHELTLRMRPPVLIPRPETEELAEMTLRSLQSLVESGAHPPRLLEIGSGSGAITVFLLKRLKDLQAVACDISPVACSLTHDNAEQVGVRDRLTIIQGDVGNYKLQSRLQCLEPFSAIVSNPPYLSTQMMEYLEPEVKWFEDPVALYGGPDGFDLVREILILAPKLLSQLGHMWLEMSPKHPEMVKHFVCEQGQRSGLVYDSTVKDLFGKDRFCFLKKTPI